MTSSFDLTSIDQVNGKIMRRILKAFESERNLCPIKPAHAFKLIPIRLNYPLIVLIEFSLIHLFLLINNLPSDSSECFVHKPLI